MNSRPVEARLTEYLHLRAAQGGVPLSGTFELTPCCNMDCKMCYVRLSQKQQQAIAPLLPASRWLELGRQAREEGMLYLLLTGGEPFLRPDFREIFQGLHWEGLVLSVNTNGTLIEEETVSWLRETPPARLNITLYGASNATYERLCGKPDGFSRVTRAIALLREAGLTVRLNCSVTPYNAEDLDDIFAYAEKEGLGVQATSYMFPPLRRDASMVGKNRRFTPEEAAYYAAKIVSKYSSEEAFVRSLQQGLPPLPSDPEEACAGEGEALRCRAGKCSFWLTWDGKMLPCGMFSADGGVKMEELSFLEAWQRTRQSVESLRLPARCTACPAKERCRVCAAMVYTESGDFTTPPQYRCDMSRGYPRACQQLAEEILERKAGSHRG